MECVVLWISVIVIKLFKMNKLWTCSSILTLTPFKENGIPYSLFLLLSVIQNSRRYRLKTLKVMFFFSFNSNYIKEILRILVIKIKKLIWFIMFGCIFHHYMSFFPHNHVALFISVDLKLWLNKYFCLRSCTQYKEEWWGLILWWVVSPMEDQITSTWVLNPNGADLSHARTCFLSILWHENMFICVYCVWFHYRVIMVMAKHHMDLMLLLAHLCQR